MDTYSNTAVAFGDLKNTALYFDYVIPVFFAADVVRDEYEALEFLTQKQELLPPEFSARQESANRPLAVNSATCYMMLKLWIKRHGGKPEISGLSAEQYEGIEREAACQYFSFVGDFNLKECPVASATGATSAWMDEEEETVPSPVVTLADMKLVDGSRLKWEHLVEFRCDKEAQDRLRRLRLFAYQNYAGRSRSYIEDDILTRVADYDSTVRKWGFETVTGALSLVLNSKLTVSVIAGGFLTTLFGQPGAALLAGAVIELGHVGIEVGKQGFALRKIVNDNPVSFISYARKRLDASEDR
ncbi:MAG: hypothetical protein JW955_06375 [Sedimentisphaerales bacterium]|nr:hypothetical protein [Sedimentisphaerales bacterium]